MQQHAHMAGITLIELLISSLLGVIVLSGVIGHLSSSNLNFTITRNAAKTQDYSRLFSQIIGTDIQRSGNLGGFAGTNELYISVFGTNPPLPPTTTCPALGVSNSFARMLDQKIFALNDSGTGLSCLIGSEYERGDVLVARYTEFTNSAGAQANGLYMNIAPSEASMFNGAEILDPQNQLIDPLIKPYRVISRAYFIGDSTRSCKGNPILSLFRLTIDADNPLPTVQELLPGVEQLQMRFLEDGTYKDPQFILNWNNVRSVRLWAVLNSECPISKQYSAETISIADHTYTPPTNGVERKVVNYTFSRRNM